MKMHRVLHFFIHSVLLLLFLTATLSASETDWNTPVKITSREGNLYFTTRGHSRKDITLRLNDPEGRVATITLKQQAVLTEIYTPGERFSSRSRTSLEEDGVSQMNEGRIEMLLKLRHTYWQLYANGRLCAKLPALLNHPDRFSQRKDDLPEGTSDGDFFQKTGPFRFSDDFLSAPDEEDPLSAWEIASGQWKIHTTQDDALEQKSADTPEGKSVKPEFSTNFYSLTGQGEPGIILGGYEFYDHYQLATAVRTETGESGLVFYHRNNDDYFGFTLGLEKEESKPALLRLFRSHPGGKVETLFAATTPLTQGQWVTLKVRISEGRIRCYLGSTLVTDHRLPLPAGGRLGLYAEGKKDLSFDDFSAETDLERDLSTPEGALQNRMAENGQITTAIVALQQKKKLPPAVPPLLFSPRPLRQEQQLLFGSDEDAPHVFSASFTPRREKMECGLVIGYTSPSKPYLRARCLRSKRTDQMTLERVSPDRKNPEVLETTTLTLALGEENAPLSLMADATTDGALRIYRNGRLTLLHLPLQLPGGGSGIFLGAGSDVTISNLVHRPEREELSRSQFEKNQNFVTDPFMRHWSSPEGEWFTDEKNLTWHKSDFLLRYQIRIPVIAAGELHLGIPEGATLGEYALRLSPGAVTVFRPAEKELPEEVLFIGRLDPGSGLIDLFLEDSLLWLKVDGNPRGMLRLRTPPAGRRVRIQGFTTTDLQNSFTIRYGTKDFLFTSAPTDWLINGGRWQVINRFACQPRWSHMNGESQISLAALWSQSRFSGDFCAEMYAGFRHAQNTYNRLGDLNLSVMSDATVPSRGYTVACTEYDPDHSQQFTTLYRNGEILARSTNYLIPRLREGNKRLRLDPLLQGGRDVHGAWYYIKLRRIGSTLEYYFDNEKIFSVTDDQPLDGGRLGIWTYMNSMMVARVKITAERMESIPAVLTPVPQVMPAAPAAESAPLPWEARDPVGHSILSVHQDPLDSRPYFVLSNQIGGGAMQAASTLPPLARKDLAGFRFLVKRTPRARFDLHYTLVRKEGDVYKPLYRGYHHLSGTDETRDLWKRFGSTTLTASPSTGADWHRQGEWTEVKAWLPESALHTFDPGASLFVQIDGFGALQSGRDNQGLTGNGPGEAYAFKDFTPIPMPAENSSLPPLTAKWHPRYPGTILLTTDSPLSCRKLAAATALIGTFSVPLIPEERGHYRLAVPKDPALLCSVMATLPLKIQSGNSLWEFSLPRQEETVNDRPVLLDIRGGSLFFTSFEGPPAPSRPLSPRMAIVPAQTEEANPAEHALTVWNDEYNQRLVTPFSIPGSLARFPLYRFRYQAPAMARVSLRINQSQNVMLFEPNAPATAVRESGRPDADLNWRAWTGIIADAIGRQPFIAQAFHTSGNLQLRSICPQDQTGRLTLLSLDDLVAGPAISTVRPITLTPEFFDFDGIATVHYALSPGLLGYEELTDQARAALTWIETGNRSPLTPSLTQLPQGPGQLFLKAVDLKGAESSVHSIPFLFDTTVPTVTSAFQRDETPESNETKLNLTVNNEGGAPLDLESIRLHWEDKEVRLDPYLSFITHTPSQDILELNWPYLLRLNLNRMQNGETGRLKVSGITDGAGNSAPDFILPVTLNTALDKTPPTIHSVRYGPAVRFAPSWYGPASNQLYLQNGHGNSSSIIRVLRQEPYLKTLSHGNTGEILWLPGNILWNLTSFPYLGLRLQRPATKAGEKEVEDASSLSLQVEFDKGPPLDILITAATPAPTNPQIPAPADKAATPAGLVPAEAWLGGRWVDLIIDLRQHLARRKTEEGTNITKLRLVRAGTVNQQPLAIASLVISREWKTEDEFTLLGFDECGIKGLNWEMTAPDGKILASGKTDADKIRPATLGLTPALGHWLLIRLRDGAGNLSLPVRIPLLVPPPPPPPPAPPAPVSTKIPAPAEEAGKAPVKEEAPGKSQPPGTPKAQ